MDMGGTGIPSEPSQPSVGTVLEDSSGHTVRSANSRIRELIRFQHVHCEIVHWVGCDLEGAGCVTHPASEISLQDSCPTHLVCMLGLMSAEQITQDLGLLCIGKERLGASSCGASGARVPCDASCSELRTCVDSEAS